MGKELTSVFQSEIKYSNHELNPKNVASVTSDIFDMYFSSQVEDFSLGGWYLISHTLPLIDAMRFGLAKNPHIIDRLSLASAEDIERVASYDKEPNMYGDEALEAFQYALVTMSYMPEVVQKWTDVAGNSNFTEFSRKGIFRPPATIDETRERIRELWVQTNRIAQQQTVRYEPILSNPSKARAVTFFTVASGLKLRNREEGNLDMKNNFPDLLAQKFDSS